MKPILYRRLLKTTALIALTVMPVHAYAGPEGGVTTSGSAAISSSGTTTTIHQSTDRAIIRWNSFDVGVSESVQFVQPSSSSITVNRIQDTKASRIDGRIGANGNIILLNPNGVVFGATAVVDVNGLVASSSDLEDDSGFMAGGAVKLTRPGRADAAIINHGSITAREGGLVGLVAPGVENHGVIEARLGRVALASGDIATIDLAGDGLIKIEVTDAVLAQHVLNTGTIRADGGSIILTAAQARGMVDALVTNTGTLQANTVTVGGVEKRGEITLSTKGLDITLPRGNGMVFATGEIKAEGVDAGQAGGMITILSDKINIGYGTYVTAAGDTDGGTIKIGGAYQGGSDLPTSDMTYVSEYAILNAQSRRRGSGGTIILWSDTNTRFYGHADVSGGMESGDGGLIEVSGKEFLDYNGTVNLAAVNGDAGLLLLDPTDITISTDPDSNILGASPFSPTIDDGPSILSVSTLQAALATGNVIVQTRATGTQAGNITISNAITWTTANTLTLDAHNDIIVNATISGRNITFNVGNDLQLNANISGTGTVTILQSNNATTIGIGAGSTGTLNLTSSDLSRIVNGWGAIVIGRTTGTGAIDMRAATWNDSLTIRSNTGVITVNGAQSMANNNLTFQTNTEVVLNSTVTSTGALLFNLSTNSTTIGIGDGQAGSMRLSNASLNNITGGWSSITFGNTSGTGAMNIGARTWARPVVFITSTGLMSVNGQQNTTSNMTLRTNSNLVINANLVGTGTLNILGASNGTTMGIGDGQAGTLSLTNVKLSRIIDGWTTLIFGSTSMTGAMNIAGRTWQDSVDFRTNSGALNINGAQNVGSNNLALRTNTNLAIGQTLTGTGLLEIAPSGNTSMGIGTGEVGTISMTNAKLANITDGWSRIIFGSTGSTAAVNVGARTWTDSVEFRSGTGVISINGAQNVGSNNLLIRSNGNPVVNAALTGTGTLTLLPTSTATTTALGTGQTGTFSFTDAELANITNGWSDIIVGSNAITGVMNVGARTWNDNLTLATSTGAININGVQTMGANNLTFLTRANPAINANLTGTGILTITPAAANTTVGIGTSQTGTISLTDTELGRISDGWSDIIIGRTDGTGTINVGAYTWSDNLTLQSATGVITVAGAQNMGANNLSILTNSNLALNANLVGTGNLTIRTASGSTTMGIGNSQTGTLNLTDAELNRIIDGWNQITFGSTAGFGAINIGAYNWRDKASFLTQADVVLNGAQTTTETTGTTLVYATTNGAFINNAGASAIDPGTGRYLVYSVNVANDTLGGIVPPIVLLNQTYAAYGPDMVVEPGSIHLYSGAAAKILYLSIDDKDVQYGYALPTLTYSYVSGLQGADTLNDAISASTLTTTGWSIFDNAGTTRIINGSFTASMGYTIVFSTGTLTVTKAEILVTVDSDSRIYGDSNPTFAAIYTGFRNGEDESDIDTLANISTTATVLSDVGSYAIVAQDADDNNYDFVYVDGTLSITKATLNAAVQASTREYGDPNPTFAINYTGFRNGDNASMIDTLATGNTAATATSNVGVYAVTASGAFDNNYNFTYTGGNMTITPATLTVTPDDVARAYGDANPPLTVSYSGFKNAETASVIDTGPTLATAANALSNVGAYSITASGATDNNYNFVYNTGTLNVTKAMLTATAGNGSREYGDVNPAIGVTYTGFRNGETQSVIDTLATAGSAANATSNVGAYATTASGGFDNNYDFIYVDGVLNITKAMLTATAGDATREYGLANPTVSVSYTGFRNGETEAVIDTLATAGSAANLTSNVGTYSTSASGGFDNNYDFTYVDGALTVTRANLIARANDAERKIGDPEPVLGVSYSGFRNGQNASVLTMAAVASTAVNAATPEGTYAITASGGLADNYTFTYVDGVFTVRPADYVPPSLSNNELPSTVSGSIGVSAPQVGIQTYGVLTPPYAQNNRVSPQGSQPIAIVTVDTDYISTWQRSPFLIAVTDDLQTFFMPQGFMPSSGGSDEYQRFWY